MIEQYLPQTNETCCSVVQLQCATGVQNIEKAKFSPTKQGHVQLLDRNLEVYNMQMLGVSTSAVWLANVHDCTYTVYIILY
jgi:hypothetical protein